MSGGRGTLHLRKGDKNTTQLGDITCVHKDGHWLTEMFYFELKHYRDLNIASSLIKGKGELAKFWKETVRRATECEREPLLIAKQNLMPAMAIFSKAGLAKFQTFKRHPKVILMSTLMMRHNSAHVCLYEDTFLTP